MTAPTSTAGLAVLDPTARRLTFHVLGDPVPQGSARVIGGRLITKTAALNYWRQVIAQRAAAAMLDHQLEPLTGPVAVAVTFRLRMPASRPAWQRRLGCLPHWRRPDVDKLARAVLDGLGDAGAYGDDGQVFDLHATKVEQAEGWLGAEVALWPVELPARPARGRRPAP